MSDGILKRESFNPESSDVRIKSLLEAVRDKTLRVLSVEPAGICNLKCTFCDLHSGRVNDVERLKGVMDFDTFKKTIDQVAASGIVLKQLQYVGYGDPLLNKNLPRFVAYAKEKGIAETQRIITNGVALTEENFLALIKAQIDIIEVSLDTVDKARYVEIKGKDFGDVVLKNLAFAIEHVVANRSCHLKIKCALPHHDGRYGVVDDDVRGIVDYFAAATERSDRITITGVPLVSIVDGLLEKKKEYTTPCEAPFYALAVRFDGSVVGCCSDALMLLKLGNIQTSTIGEIIRGDKLRALRSNHLNADFKTTPLCLYCENRPAADLTGVIDDLRKII